MRISSVRPDGTARLNVGAKAPDGTPLAGLSVFGRLERPTDRRADQVVRDRRDAAAATIAAPRMASPPGQWDLVIEADRDGQRLFLSRNRVVLN